MQAKFILSFLLVFAVHTSALAAHPSEYLAVDISSWSEPQLETLPYFERYNPVDPAGAPLDYAPVADNGVGLSSGNRGTGDITGAYVAGGSSSNINAWGTFYWSYWIYDGKDYHYYFGNVTHSPVRDANVFGQIVGYATLAGSSNGYNSTSGYDDHGYLFDTATGQKHDLTPTAHRADLRSINDYGEITGYWWNDSESHPFRRSADGTFTDLVSTQTYSHSISPQLINNQGHVAGFLTVWTTPRHYAVLFSESGASTEELPWPDQGGSDTGTIADMNEHDVIVGESHQAASPVETLATRWTREGGVWTAEALDELLSDASPDIILDRCVAVNDAGHIIATGHPDGTDTQNTKTYLLIPDVFPQPAVATLPASDITSTGATLRAKINAGGLDSAWTLSLGTNMPPLDPVSSGTVTGTHPVLAGVAVTGLQPHTVYYFSATGTNDTGMSLGYTLTFTTAWNWVGWSADIGSAGPEDDANTNGTPDLLDFVTGGGGLQISPQGSGPGVSFYHAIDADGVHLTAQVSSNLVEWQDGPMYGFDASIPSNAYGCEMSRMPSGTNMEHIVIGTDSNMPHRHFRLKATLL